MKRIKANSKMFLSDSRRDLLASCLVIITAFVLMFNVVGFSAKAYPLLLTIDSIYIILLCGFVLLLTENIKSEALKNLMSFLGVIGAIASVFLLWAIFSFQI